MVKSNDINVIVDLDKFTYIILYYVSEKICKHNNKILSGSHSFNYLQGHLQGQGHHTHSGTLLTQVVGLVT